jgi:DNA-binding XRE family transcriptional regulator
MPRGFKTPTFTLGNRTYVVIEASVLDDLTGESNRALGAAEASDAPSPAGESFATYLERTRAELRVDQYDIAAAAECTQGHISNLEKGKRTPGLGLELAIRGYFDRVRGERGG